MIDEKTRRHAARIRDLTQRLNIAVSDAYVANMRVTFRVTDEEYLRIGAFDRNPPGTMIISDCPQVVIEEIMLVQAVEPQEDPFE